ncbi:uncharacterized protein PGTG_16446 [Puccinia graminis f. sp. tritici CRL 75-36-700-3]|uniref:Tet-like 2OG-Fe(II) oxygenase domain-containing protein n=1 Tax=Puccinia graminis f. sp. tritici (strain CRL 75-36-700-3 / race SCCL) TaxID=418459 RepID=E3L0U3_PUCGT|nr:uncharacterized protein PGTG_16446 [Puccinia graminis f. sp. tritici CRL 75-36-700-3]EFP90168.1 hypothetical protein PGTG_16446 [Puccinia graminis f. sp. tritici CRL 75-36-700-3]
MTFHPDDISDSSLTDISSSSSESEPEDKGSFTNDLFLISSARKAKKKRRRNKNWSEKRNAKCKQATAMFLTNLPPNCGSVISDVKVVAKRDLFPDITAETKQAKIERKLARKRFKKAGGPLPPKKKISDWLPTPEEIATASSIVEDPTKFRLYDHGHVCIFDKQLTTEKEKQIMADITFTDLKTISNQKRDDLNFLVAFLEKSKKFVNSIGSKSRSCGGYMWAIGWRKSMTKFEIIGRYVNKAAIKKNQEEFNQHVKDSDRASSILWDLFYPIGNRALEANQQFMAEHNLPSLSDPELPSETSKGHDKFFSTNLTFTSDGFFNHPHKDKKDDKRLPFAFFLSLPTFKSKGRLAFESDGYDVTGGQFVFPECGFGIDFKPDTMVQMIFAQRLYTHGTLKPTENGKFTKLGMSLQISEKTTNMLDRILAEEFVTKPEMHVGDVPHIMNQVQK